MYTNNTYTHITFNANTYIYGYAYQNNLFYFHKTITHKKPAALFETKDTETTITDIHISLHNVHTIDNLISGAFKINLNKQSINYVWIATQTCKSDRSCDHVKIAAQIFALGCAIHGPLFRTS